MAMTQSHQRQWATQIASSKHLLRKTLTLCTVQGWNMLAKYQHKMGNSKPESFVSTKKTYQAKNGLMTETVTHLCFWVLKKLPNWQKFRSWEILWVSRTLERFRNSDNWEMFSSIRCQPFQASSENWKLNSSSPTFYYNGNVDDSMVVVLDYLSIIEVKLLLKTLRGRNTSGRKSKLSNLAILNHQNLSKIENVRQ